MHSLRITAATYLGLSVTALRDATRAGKSLGQVAQETGGKSEAGLIEALVAVRKNELEEDVKAGRVSASEESTLVSALQQRMTVYVRRAPRIHASPRTSTTPTP